MIHHLIDGREFASTWLASAIVPLNSLHVKMSKCAINSRTSALVTRSMIRSHIEFHCMCSASAIKRQTNNIRCEMFAIVLREKRSALGISSSIIQHSLRIIFITGSKTSSEKSWSEKHTENQINWKMHCAKQNRKEIQLRMRTR